MEVISEAKRKKEACWHLPFSYLLSCPCLSWANVAGGQPARSLEVVECRSRPLQGKAEQARCGEWGPGRQVPRLNLLAVAR